MACKDVTREPEARSKRWGRERDTRSTYCTCVEFSARFSRTSVSKREGGSNAEEHGREERIAYAHARLVLRISAELFAWVGFASGREGES